MSYKRVIITDFGGPDVLRLIDEKELPEPGPGEVRVKVLTAGASFTDVMIRKGMYPDVKTKPPFTPGYDLIGVVDKLGEDVTLFKIGEKVADLSVIGAYSEYINIHESRLTPVPDDLDEGEAVSLILSYLTAYQMLHRYAKVQNGQRVLIHGAGGAVGTALLQLGRLMNLEMYGTASESKHDTIRRMGAKPIDYRKEDFLEALHLGDGEGIDAVFDPIGGSNFQRSFSALRRGGILVAFGFYNAVSGKGGSIPLDLIRLQLWNLFPNGRSTSFYSIGALRKKHPDWFREDLSKLFNLLQQGKIKPVIGARLNLDDVKHAHELIEDASLPGKIVLSI